MLVITIFSATLFLLLVCFRTPYLAVVIFVGSSLFIPPSMDIAGIPLHLADCGFLLIAMTFVLRHGHRLDLTLARHNVTALSLLIGIIGCAAAVNGYLVFAVVYLFVSRIFVLSACIVVA